MQNGNNTVPVSWVLPGEISERAYDMQSLVPGLRKEGGNGPEDTGLVQDSRRKLVVLFSWFAGQNGQGSKRGQETRWGRWTYTSRSATPLGAAGRVRPGRRSPGTHATPWILPWASSRYLLGDSRPHLVSPCMGLLGQQLMRWRKRLRFKQ